MLYLSGSKENRKMFRLSRHAKERIQDRPVTTEHEVLEQVQKFAPRITTAKTQEVKVVVKRLHGKVSFEDGSNGDVVLACVDPNTKVVKTVMLQRSSQVVRKAAETRDYIW